MIDWIQRSTKTFRFGELFVGSELWPTRGFTPNAENNVLPALFYGVCSERTIGARAACEIVCGQRLGGLLKSYLRRAA